MNQDPWDWVDQKKVVAPLSAAIQASQEQAPGVIQQPADPLTQMAQQGAVNAAAKGLEAGYKAYGAPLSQTATAANTLGTTATGAQVALPNALAAAAPAAEAGMYTLSAPLAGGAGLGIGTGAASTIGAGLGEAALGTAATTGAATAGTAATAGATGAAMAGGEAALAAMGPVGWAIGAGLLAHKLGIF